jgi:SAM-dependent methyltransferase
MGDERRVFVHGLWESVATNWIERADYLEDRGASVTKTLLERAAITQSDRVLALADGAGGMALAAAPLAREVVSSDVVAPLVAAAQQRAAEHGYRNMTAQVIDIEDIDAPDATFDAVVSREGLMFAVDPQRAFDEVARVLRPGGRMAAAVWGEPDANPWLAIVLRAVSDTVGHEVPPPGMPGPFALSDESQLIALTERAGLTGVVVDRVDVPFVAPSFEAWWDHTRALAGPVANIVNGLDADRAAALDEHLRAGVAPYLTSDGIELPGLSLVVSARKA